MEKRKINLYKFITTLLKIKPKDEPVKIIEPNEPQKELYRTIYKLEQESKPIRIIILKARQMGFSTMTEALIFARTITNTHINSGIITHKDEATNNLFTMTKNYYDWLPDNFKPSLKASNAKELIFDNKDRTGIDSQIKVLTATDDAGRSNTFQNLHISELAFWKCDINKALASLMAAVPNSPKSMIIIESTANGYNEFKTMWDNAVNGSNGFTPLFFAWFQMPDYRRPVPFDFELTYEEERLKERFGLDNEQIQWRRETLRTVCNGDINLFRQEYPSTPEEAFIATGNSYFNNEVVNARLEQVKKPLKKGFFKYKYNGLTISDIEWVDDEFGYINIYKDVDNYTPYVIGGDTSGDGSDFFIGQVLDNTNGEQVAVLRHQFDEDLYARQMYCLGMYYNSALLGVESNFSTFPIKELLRIGYPKTKMYVREVADTFTGRLQEKFGFRTTTITRPAMLAELAKIVRENPESINDRTTLLEMLTFVKNERGKAEAITGYHDDTIMALAIAHAIRGQQSYEKSERIVSKIKKNAFYWADDEVETERGFVEW